MIYLRWIGWGLNLFLFFMGLAWVGVLSGFAAPLEHRLEDLRDGRLIELKAKSPSSVVLSFFRPRCTGCKEQLKELNCLKQQSPSASIVAIGIGGNTQELRQSIRGIALSFPAGEASPEFLKEIGPIEMTPSTWIFGSTPGKQVKKFQGLQRCQDLMKVLSEIERGE